MTIIQLSNEHAAALAAKAAALGLSLEEWLRMRAAGDEPTARSRPRKVLYTLSDLIGQYDLSASSTTEGHAWLETPPLGCEAL